MNKKQEALRRELRSFIEDASRELADLEGRELSPRPRDVVDDAVAPPAQDATPTPAARDAGTVPAPRDATPAPAARNAGTVPASRDATPTPAAQDIAAVPSPQDALPVHATRDAATAPVGQDAVQPLSASWPAPLVQGVSEPASELPSSRGGGAADPQDGARTQATAPAPLTRQPEAVQAVPPAPAPGAPVPTQGEPISDREAEVPGKGALGTSREERRKRTRARPRRRAAPSIGVDGMSLQRLRSRKGVCSAYFINEQCWQIPEAYCNTALQVCIMRECPVYHLHKEALERRFARKFKHLW